MDDGPYLTLDNALASGRWRLPIQESTPHFSSPVFNCDKFNNSTLESYISVPPPKIPKSEDSLSLSATSDEPCGQLIIHDEHRPSVPTDLEALPPESSAHTSTAQQSASKFNSNSDALRPERVQMPILPSATGEFKLCNNSDCMKSIMLSTCYNYNFCIIIFTIIYR